MPAISLFIYSSFNCCRYDRCRRNLPSALSTTLCNLATTPFRRIAWRRPSTRGLLHHCPQIPRHEFVLSVTVQFAFAFLARRGVQDHLEKSFADLIDGRGAVDDFAAVDIDVFFLAVP